MQTRKQGARALAAGLLCWAVNVALLLTAGMYGPILVILGALGVWAGAVLLIWGDGFRAMPPAQKLPAALISLALAGVPAFFLAQWAQRLAHR